MYVLPSAKDKRIAALRLAARTAGLDVKLSSIDMLDPEAHERVSSSGVQKSPKIACAAYRLAHQVDALTDVDSHCLLRLPARPTVPNTEVFPGWAITSGSLEWWQKADAFWLSWLADLPEQVLAVAVDMRIIACYWRENADAESDVVETMARQLEVAQKHFSS